ncbi:MAG TPA: hypothetical protein VFV66_29780 [Nonomuraea sp.]|nr:hypothetical protein [Nonomuraea sp.]
MPSRTTFTLPVLVLAALAPAAPVGGPGAYAAAPSISCHVAGEAVFSPGVQAVGQEHRVGYLGDERDCVDHSGIGIDSARLDAAFEDVRLSCRARDVGGGRGTATVTWKAGGVELTSVADVEVERTSGDTATVTGVVREGPFGGRRLTARLRTGLVGGNGRCAAVNREEAAEVRGSAFTGDLAIG